MKHATRRFDWSRCGAGLVRSLVAAASILAVLGGAICDDPAQPGPRQASPGVVPTSETAAPQADEGAQPQSAEARPEATIPRFIHSEEAIGVASAASGLKEVSDGLGYALVPTRLPPDFKLTKARLVDFPRRLMATTFFESGQLGLALFYPAFFTPSPERVDEPGIFSPPADAVVRVVVSGELAYLMKGEWDDSTVQLLASYTAQWDYNGRLTLYFPYQASPGDVRWAMLSANTKRSSWIDVGGLIEIAESVIAIP